jgi:putative nucleotidyltransferase with HDIG domain
MRILPDEVIMEEPIPTSPDDVVETLLFALELRNAESANHGRRVADISLQIGKNMGLGDRDLVVLRRGALLHDIGRIGIPDRILAKNETLADEDWEIIRKHPENGAKLLKKIPSLQETIQVIAFHHERWDGFGYPAHLAGEKIPLLARICAVAEVFDALISEQVYRKAWPRPKALLVIENDVLKAFDPLVVKTLVKMENLF